MSKTVAGTGKTTVARKIGQVFYNMGILASAEVIECSASDLVGQYVGQTGPKTKKLFQKALGKVLFIDEAYRLAAGQFSQEAVDELVGLLTHTDFKSKLIVVLAGYEKDMNQLMAVNSGLSSRFPDQIFFHNMDAEHCLEVITRELQKNGIETHTWDTQSNNPPIVEMKELINDMSELPDWGNARDMITASKEMVNRALRSLKGASPAAQPMFSPKDALDVMRDMLAARQKRSKIPPSRRRQTFGLPEQSFTRHSEPPPALSPSTSTDASPSPADTQATTPTSPPANVNQGNYHVAFNSIKIEIGY